MLVKNIKQLLQTRDEELKLPLRGTDLAHLPLIENAWILCEDGLIKDYGSMDNCPDFQGKIIDASGRVVLPTYVDSHTHLVHAGSRSEEFAMRIKGQSYEAIAQAGGGILNSAKKLQETSEEDLFHDAYLRLQDFIKMGTGAIEIKSGYGLSVEAELKMLRVIQRLKTFSPIPIKANFLAAHFYPAEYKENHQGYIDLIIHEMLPKIAEDKLADYMDAFCEKVAFSADEMDELLTAADQYGLKAKVHTNQFNSMGGIACAIKHKALSVDHLEVINEEEIAQLQESNTMACLLPSAPFFLSDPYQPARAIIDAGIPVALASDYNPGSSPSGRMSFVLSLACVKLNMSPEEAINAATINGAFALELENELGSISKGKKANFILSKKIKDYNDIPYSFGADQIESVYINGIAQ